MIRCILALVCLLLAACAAAPLPPPAPDAVHWRDDAFAAPSVRIAAADVFAPSDEMKAFLARNVGRSMRDLDLRRQLVDMLYRRQDLGLEYDSSTTRTAAETYAARSGNCLSLVIMTAAFAKELGLPVNYQRVYVDEAWSRNGDLYFASGHVNLALEWTPTTSRFVRNFDTPLVVDFLPAEELRGQRVQSIGEQTILAMFMNNRAAEALVRGTLDDAYGWAREAVRQDPRFLAGLNTLGVIYLRRGLAADAEQVFADLLRREPDNPKVMGNLVHALRQQPGRETDADALTVRLAQLEPYPPFHWFNAGLAAMREHDYMHARDYFAKELRREAYYHEFHFWLAQAELALGNLKQARVHLEMAMQGSTTPHDHDLYSAKLDRLRAYRTQ